MSIRLDERVRVDTLSLGSDANFNVDRNPKKTRRTIFNQFCQLGNVGRNAIAVTASYDYVNSSKSITGVTVFD